MLENKIKTQHKKRPGFKNKIKYILFSFCKEIISLLDPPGMVNGLRADLTHFQGNSLQSQFEKFHWNWDIFTFQFAFPAAICFWSCLFFFFFSLQTPGCFFSESEHQSSFHRQGEKRYFFQTSYPLPSSLQEFLASRSKLRVIPSLCWIKHLQSPNFKHFIFAAVT